MALIYDNVVTIREADESVNTGFEARNGDWLRLYAWGRIWAGVWFTGENGPQGWNDLARHANYPDPGSRRYSLLVHVGDNYQYVGTGWSRTHTLGNGRVFLRINDDVPGNGSGAFKCAMQVWRG